MGLHIVKNLPSHSRILDSTSKARQAAGGNCTHVKPSRRHSDHRRFVLGLPDFHHRAMRHVREIGTGPYPDARKRSLPMATPMLARRGAQEMLR
jgi:hypothetical protein